MNKLAHLEEFQQILANYHISAGSQNVLKQTNFVLLVAPTSAGRNTIIHQLLKTGEYYFVVSDTTRKPRENDGVMEEDGGAYWFRSEEDVLTDLRGGKFLEAAIIHNQQVSGISIRELQKARELEKIAITDIEIVGAETIMNIKPDTVAIFVLPPSFEEWQRRLTHRGRMNPDEVRRRMESAQAEFAAALEHNYYTFVINDTVEHAMEQIHQAAYYGAINHEAQEHGRNVAEQLYIETTAYLRNM